MRTIQTLIVAAIAILLVAALAPRPAHTQDTPMLPCQAESGKMLAGAPETGATDCEAAALPMDGNGDAGAGLSNAALARSASLAWPIRTLPDLRQVVIHEVTFGTTANEYGPSAPALMTRLADPLDEGNNDFRFYRGEYYDVFYSDAGGHQDADGAYITIEGVWRYDDWNLGGMNIAEVELRFEGERHDYGDFVASSAFGSICAPERIAHCISGSEALAADGDMATFPRFGQTSVGNLSDRFRLTIGFIDIHSEPEGSALANLAFADFSTRFDEIARRALLSFCVVNRGEAASNEGTVSIRDSLAVVGTLTVGALSASNQACYNDVAMPTLEDFAGTRPYELIADADNTTSESDENDNTHTVSVAVPELPAPTDYVTAVQPEGEPTHMSPALVVIAITGAAILSGGMVFLLVRPRGGKQAEHVQSKSIHFRGRPDPGTQVTQSAWAEIVLPRLQLRGHADPGRQRIEMRESPVHIAGE